MGEQRAVDRAIERALQSEGPAPSAMRALLVSCEEEYPHEIWRKLLGLAYEDDVAVMTEWLELVLTRNPPKPRISELSFGLYDRYQGDGRSVIEAFVEGRTSDLRSKGLLARLSGSFYFPSGRYAPSKVIGKIGRLFTKKAQKELGRVFPSDIAQSYLSLFVLDFASSRSGLLRGGASRRELVTRWDAAVMNLGFVDAGGFNKVFRVEQL